MYRRGERAFMHRLRGAVDGRRLANRGKMLETPA